jgi:hypothetical protein
LRPSLGTLVKEDRRLLGDKGRLRVRGQNTILICELKEGAGAKESGCVLLRSLSRTKQPFSGALEGYLSRARVAKSWQWDTPLLLRAVQGV